MGQQRLTKFKLKGRHCRWWRALACLVLGLVLSMGLPVTPILSQTVTSAAEVAQPMANDAMFEQQGTAQFTAGNYAQAAADWEQAIAHYRAAGDWLAQARTLSNLALAQQRLGQWATATAAIEQSLALLQAQGGADSAPLVWAQVLNTQGNLQFGLGQMEAAIATWQTATTAYAAAGNELGALQSQMNLALALKVAGFYQRAHDQLADVVSRLQSQPDSPLKASALQRWGDVLRLMGDFDEAEVALTQSLDIAQTLGANEELASTLLSLGNTKRVRQEIEAAQRFYQQAIALDLPSASRILAQLASLSLAVQQQQWSMAQTLWPTIAADLQQQPASHQGIYNQINLAVSLIRFKQNSSDLAVQPEWQTIVQILSQTVEQAQGLNDLLGQSYALGYLGSVYEQTQQRAVAQRLTEQAMGLAQTINEGEAAYLWQWQLGRLLQAENQVERAIAAYGEAIDTLTTLRSDLATINADLQYSFQEDVEPVYREFVSLLLKSDQGQEPSSARLAQARQVIESLQIAELDNYFQEACLQGQPVLIDQLEAQSAVLYPIILADRLELILSLPQGQFRHYTQPIPKDNLERLIQQFRNNLVILSRRDFFAPAQQLYDVLVRPAIADLRSNNIETLVFVLDGKLKNIPMAALYDGHQYLIEEFAVALSPGLQLISPQPLIEQQLNILIAGLTEGRQGFSPLSYVGTEVEIIRSVLPKGTSLLNTAFTRTALKDQVEANNFPIVHIATHGQFSSDRNNTFLVAWDDLIKVSELSSILQDNIVRPGSPLELLVLSACQTAAGDEQAALGLAGVALKAGARSTLATLWSTNDAATSDFMAIFYEELIKPNATRAGALRHAQLAFLQDVTLRHPLYWAPFVMLGSWL